MPWRCAEPITPSQSSVIDFFGATSWRTRSTRISPPPPGMESSPAAASASTTSSTLIRKRLAKNSTSDGEKPCTWIGWCRLMYRIRSRYHSNGMYGIVPALQEDLHGPDRLRLVDLRADLLEREDVAFRVLRPPVERAELAVGDAHVGVVDVAVDDVRDDVVGVPLAALRVGEGAQLGERGALVQLEQFGRFGHRPPLRRAHEGQRAVGHRAAGRQAAQEVGEAGQVPVRQAVVEAAQVLGADAPRPRRCALRRGRSRARRGARGPSFRLASSARCTSAHRRRGRRRAAPPRPRRRTAGRSTPSTPRRGPPRAGTGAGRRGGAPRRR